MEAQSDYIKDFQRRLQSEYQKAGLLTIPEVDSPSAGDILAMPWLSGGQGDTGSTNPFCPSHPNPGVTRTPSCPLLDLPKAWSAEGSADQAAGGSGVRRFYSVDDQRRPSVSFAFPPEPEKGPTSEKVLGSPVAKSPTSRFPFPEAREATEETNVSEVAKEVVRLRLLKKQHDELQEQLRRGEAQLRRLPPCSVLQFYSFLERNLGESGTGTAAVPEAMIKLVECLCAVCGVAITSHKSEGLLGSIRMLLREPHSFTSKLCNMPHVSGDVAQGLAPFLLSEVQYKRLRDKEVNACYDAMYAWLSAFYFFSVISDQVEPTAQELERNEALLKRLNAEGISRSKSVPDLSPRGAVPKIEAPKTRGSMPAKRSVSVEEDDKLGCTGSTNSRSSLGGQAGSAGPRGSTSPLVPSRPGGVTRRTNAPTASAIQAAMKKTPSDTGLRVGAGSTGMTRMQSDAVLSTMRSNKREPPASPVLQSRSARAPLAVGSPLPAVPERQLLETSAPVHRRSTAPPLRPSGC